MCVAFADFAISNHPQHVMGGMSNLSAVALAAQLSAAAGANFTGAFPNYHGAVVSGNTTSSGKLNIQKVWGNFIEVKLPISIYCLSARHYDSVG